MIVFDARNPRAVRAAEALRAALPDGWSNDALKVVLGGDGFLLRTAAAADFEGIFLGLNAGHLGFLHNAVDDWDQVARRLVQGRYRPHRFPLLKARFALRNGHTVDALAMNDVYLERATGQAARLSLSVDGVSVVDNLVADGLILATALGSTAYSFSAGGSPAHPLLHLLKVTPICPHLPRMTSFDLPESSHVRVEVLVEDRRPARAVVDGQELGEVRAVDVGFSEVQVQLAYFEDHDFTTHLLTKIVKP